MKAEKIHFIGIGGISMSSLAEILLSEGKKITGSDGVASPITKHLASLGVDISIGQKKENIKGDEDLIVYTAAVSEDNEELIQARKSKAEVIDRAELVGRMMLEYHHPISVAGTHGKTTTSSMLSEVFLKAGKNPTISIGGILPSIGGNYKVGGKDFFVLETCEYSDSFLKFHPYSAIILNVDADHLDYFKNLDNIYRSFNKFAKIVPGSLVINNDIERLSEVLEGVKANIITYGKDEKADWYPLNVQYDEKGHGEYDIYFKGEYKNRVKLSIPGYHNVLNSVAVYALADSFGIDPENIKEGISAFEGTDRRFQFKGEFNGVKVIDDYAHHPTEIDATINSARSNDIEKLHIIFQPHTYTRTLSLLDDFASVLKKADDVILLDIYASREKDTGLVSSRDLEKKIKDMGGNVTYCESFEKAGILAKECCKKGDMLITMGAGDVYKIGEELVKN
ncbi:MAG: UDP-N-acetylmuramate--L-alanine ligase [Firmicutes bacterium]|nr:UDP-N-acetylmuramate--L-alanine ligase [Bacillota bacterium]